MKMGRKSYPASDSDYKLLEKVGYGASATVYRAICLPFNEVVAVKCLDLDRCNSNLVPIQVNKHIAFSDGMKIIDRFAKVSSRTYKSQDLMTRELDEPDGNPCFATMEFGLVRNMTVAADEERYIDAAKWRDELSQLRTQRSDRTKKV